MLPDLTKFSISCWVYWLSKVFKFQCPDLAQLYLVVHVLKLQKIALLILELSFYLLGKNKLNCFILNRKDSQNQQIKYFLTAQVLNQPWFCLCWRLFNFLTAFAGSGCYLPCGHLLQHFVLSCEQQQILKKKSLSMKHL